jgi:hypothetical protein
MTALEISAAATKFVNCIFPSRTLDFDEVMGMVDQHSVSKEKGRIDF